MFTLCYHSNMLLSDHKYVHQCLKLGTDVHVTMVKLTDVNQTSSDVVRSSYVNCTLCLYVVNIISLLLSKKTISAVSKTILFPLLSEHSAIYSIVIYFLPISRNELNTILCMFFDKVDQYRICIQSNNTKMVGVVK